jgi:hypothetical protein
MNEGQMDVNEGKYFWMGDNIVLHLGHGWIKYEISQTSESSNIIRSQVRVSFDGANEIEPQGVDKLKHEINYLIGNNPELWRQGLANFREIWYYNLWNGIDLRFYFFERSLKYDMIIHPGSSPDNILMTYEGADSLSIESSTGDLVIDTSLGTIKDEAPWAYQIITREKKTIECEFNIQKGYQLRFIIGQYDRTKTLVIDPKLLYSSYIGGTGEDNEGEVVADDNGNIYVFGWTYSTDFPVTPGGYQTIKKSGRDLYVIKYSDNGTTREFSTFIGGNDDEWGYRMHVTDSGKMYLTGSTKSTNLPTTNDAYDQVHNGDHDIYLLILNASGSSIDYGTYIGGYAFDRARDIFVDQKGAVYLTGQARGTGFPVTEGAYQTSSAGDWDAFVLKLNVSDSSLSYSTYIGGSGRDAGEHILVDSEGNTYVTGWTGGEFPTTVDAYNRLSNGQYDVFILKLNSDGSDIIYSSLFGGNGDDMSYQLLLDDQEDIFIAGSTTSDNMPTTMMAVQDEYGGGSADGFLIKLTNNCSNLLYGTYVGGSGYDIVGSISSSSTGRIYIFGSTTSIDFPTTSNALNKTSNGNEDFLIGLFDITNTTPIYSSYLGGSGTERVWPTAKNLDVDRFGNVCVFGRTSSRNFPTTNDAFDGNYNGDWDVVLVRFKIVDQPPNWSEISTLTAVEDVPLIYDYSLNVSDADTPLEDLTITSTSPYVDSIDGLVVTFLFPNGVLIADIILSLTDSISNVNRVQHIVITPVNDPPSHNLPYSFIATEDTELTINLTLYVWDIDNDTDDINIIIDDPYATVRGHNITVLFPEGFTQYILTFNLSDGLLMTEAHIHFFIQGIDDPPWVDTLNEFNATEDEDSIFVLTPFLHDSDTPIDELTIKVFDTNCSVQGQGIICHFLEGGITLTIDIEVADAVNRVIVHMIVNVIEVNDPPSIGDIPPRLILEEEETIIDLSDYIYDEDNSSSDLKLDCTHPSVVAIIGLGITFLYPAWVAEHRISFTVSDGLDDSEGTFLMRIRAVNDPPIIERVGDWSEDVIITLPEGTERWYDIVVKDEDNSVIYFSIESEWDGIEVYANGTLRIIAEAGEIGEYFGTITVDDKSGGTGSIDLRINVKNVNDPPSKLLIIKPLNHTIIIEGQNISFQVEVDDPDMSIGQILQIKWISNISGIIRAMTSDTDLNFQVDTLPIGIHRINITASDDEYSISEWISVTVIEEYIPPPPDPDDPDISTGQDRLVILVVIIMMLIGGLALYLNWYNNKNK